MPASITQVEVALRDIWGGYSLTIFDRVGGTKQVSVPFFIDDPDTENYVERVFPCISLNFVSLEDAPETRESFGENIVSTDTSGFPFTSTTQRQVEWVRCMFQLHSWSLQASADRDLTTWIHSRKIWADYIEANGNKYWISRESMVNADVIDGDRKIYHKVWSLDVLFDLENVDTQIVVNQVHQVNSTVGQFKTSPGSELVLPVDETGNIVSPVDAVFIEDRTTAIDSTGFWFV